jgi:lauroyl/myristoyl acyltransferase
VAPRFRTTYLALSIASLTLSMFPMRIRRGLGSALGFVAGTILRVRRKVVEHAMADARIAAPSHVADAM